MNEQKRGIIFANGDLPDREAARALLRPGDLLIAADGGLRHLRPLGLQPNVLVGDLDSADPQEVLRLEGAGVSIERHPTHKDETDLELAIQRALSMGCREIIVIGGLGGRLDQTLGNLYLLRAASTVDLRARLDDGRVEAFWIDRQAKLHGQIGERVSLLPLLGKAQGVRTLGLEYALNGETLLPEQARVISNVLSATRAEVSVESGSLLCIHERGRG